MKTTFSDLTHEDIDRILDIVNRVHDVDLQLTVGELTLHVRKGNISAPVASSGPEVAMPSAQAVATPPIAAASQPNLPVAAAVDMAPAAGVAAEEGLAEIVAPMMGRFYSKPSPNEPNFVTVGAKVGPDDSVCMIEVMKLFNTVKAGVAGEIVEIIVQDGQMVEEGDVLFRVRPQ